MVCTDFTKLFIKNECETWKCRKLTVGTVTKIPGNFIAIALNFQLFVHGNVYVYVYVAIQWSS